jgi:hypothetical protein
MDSSSPVKVAAAQVGSVLFDVPSTLVKVDHICRQAAEASIRLLVFPAVVRRYTRLTITNANSSGIEFIHLGLLPKTPF